MASVISWRVGRFVKLLFEWMLWNVMDGSVPHIAVITE